MRFNREQARQVLLDSALGNDLDVVLDGLEECIEPDGWNAIMRILGTYYRESIFPQRSVDADWGNGPQVVSLLRLLNEAEEKLGRERSGNDAAPPIPPGRCGDNAPHRRACLCELLAGHAGMHQAPDWEAIPAGELMVAPIVYWKGHDA